MILVEKITIEEFRGIRNLTLDFNGNNFAICGPNGTGKSGVVDALEFGLTGSISRLSGKGTGEISLKGHAPHVDNRKNPEKSKVTLTLRIPSLDNKQVTIERNVKEPLTPKINPDTVEVIEILQQLADHPEFVLSRRELITYILATPGDRSTEIQALLRLGQIGDLRSALIKITNSCDREALESKNINKQKASHLAQGLEITELNKESLLKAVNSRRTVLGLKPIETLTNKTSLREGLGENAKKTIPSKINKIQALDTIKKTRELFQGISKTYDECNSLNGEILKLNKNSESIDNISKEKFLRKAIEFATENYCPVCDTKWDIVMLHDVIEKKLKKFEEDGKIRMALEKRLLPVIHILEGITDNLLSLEEYAKLIVNEKIKPLNDYRLDIEKRKEHLKNFVPLTDTVSSLSNLSSIPIETASAVDDIEKAILLIPEPTQQEAARDYLILCQDRLETYRESAQNAKKAKERAELARKIYDTYVKINDTVLEEIYKKVEEKFGEYYRFINHDDEGSFTAHLIPSLGKLSFNVDFYGRGHFPPGAYHSEGHQDGMGLCLYLALMQQLQGDNFSFAVLDDVLMSVDTGHRREVCKLLKERFPNTQFILTTHDEVWLKHMSTVGLIDPKNSIRFNSWTPDYGPTEWNNFDIWNEINLALKKDDVHTAAGHLRYYLEYVFKEICENLHAQVEFRGDGRYELGDLLPSGVKKLKNILADAEKVASSWGQTTEVEKIKAREKELANCFTAFNADQWQINPAIHYNEWANLSSADFKPVVAAFHNLIQQFMCCEKSGCGSLLYVSTTPPKTYDALRCTCGMVNINLKKNKKAGQ